MNALTFEEKTGRVPEQDDLERVNCKKAGQIGHLNCGWCSFHDKPKLQCVCWTFKFVGKHLP